MEVEFQHKHLEDVHVGTASLGLGEVVDAKYRQLVDYIWEARDERDFYELKSLHFEKLEGRGEDRSMRINKQWRLIVQLEGKGTTKRVKVLGIEDYH